MPYEDHKRTIALLCGHYKPIELDKQPCSYRVMLLLIDVIFAFLTFDPLLIYKGFQNKMQPKYRIFRMEGLKLEPCFRDRMRAVWTDIALTIELYLLLRYACICIIQVMSYKLSVGDLPEEYEVIINKINSLTGNPLSAYTGTTIILYSSLVATISIYIFLTRFYRTVPMDAVNLRFMIDPMREIRRIDTITKEKIDSMLHSINIYKSPYSKYAADSARREACENALAVDLDSDVNVRPTYWSQRRKNSYMNLQDLGRFQDIAGILRENCWIFRPRNYENDFYYVLYKFTIFVVSVTVGCSLPLLFLVPYALVGLSASAKCEQLKLKSCDPRQVFDWIDVIAFVDLVVGFFHMGVLLLVQMITISTNLFSQFQITKYLYEDLCACHRVITYWNVFHASPIKSTEDQLVRPKVDTEESEFYLDALMMKILIKFTLASEDIRKNAMFISQLVEGFGSIVGVALMAALVAGHLNGSDLFYFRMAVAVFVWCSSNILFSAVAYVWARTADVERKGLSILAELCFRSRVHNRPGSFELIRSGWRRLVHGQGISGKHDTISFYGLRVTFKRVLEMNFLIASLASLLR